VAGEVTTPARAGFHFGPKIKRRKIRLSRAEMGTLLGAASRFRRLWMDMSDEEENPPSGLWFAEAVRAVRIRVGAIDLDGGTSPGCSENFNVSMVRVGEEAGALQRVMVELADLLEHEDEWRSEVTSAVAYPIFVLGFGC